VSEEIGSFEFSFDGATVRGRHGQSIAGALHDSERHVLSRSFKYHRPRGLLCAAGRCPNCLCTVDGTPNVRICTMDAKAGMSVRSQNAWPSTTFDLLAIFDRLHRFMPVGFYYKRMYRPRWMWPIWEKFIRRVAGLGSVDRRRGAEGLYDKLNLYCDAAVVGGGWAGLHAALEAAEAGVDVVLIDEQPELGGHMRHDPDLRSAELPALIKRVEQHPRIQVLKRAVAFGAYEENYLGIQQGSRLIRLRAEQVVIATGGWERPLVFENNDLPGILLASGAQRLVYLDGCRFPGRAVVVTDSAQGYRVARQLKAAGTHVVAIADVRAQADDRADGITVYRGHTVLAARGRGHVKSAVLAPLAGGGLQQELACSWIIQAVGFTPANSLLYQNGSKLTYDASTDLATVARYAPGMHAAGSVTGAFDLARAALEGRKAGIAAAAAAKPDDNALGGRLQELERQLGHLGARIPQVTAHYVSASTAKKKFVCLCEDVTEKDIADAVTEGYSNIETLKRYSTVSMGPCQGKMCQSASIALCAKANGLSIAETGVTTSRPPEQPLPLGVLAGRALHLSLIRRTPLHHWHERNGAIMMDAGNWKRPHIYTSPEKEYEAVRQRAGLIDVSTLGKLELRGRDVVKFLEFIFPNRFESLKVGRMRYGVVCDDAGIILDDGTINRLGEDRFYLTTSTGNADAVDSWFRWWLAAKPHLDVRMTNLTGSYAGMNLAGPRSREILQKLTDADVSTASFPYLAVGEIAVAGVPAIVLRIGFVGELGYEIHVPSQYGQAVWEAIMEAGRQHGLEPFGIEAQRQLRLDKKHFLPGVDTDALSIPLEADIPWVVMLDKEDFIGKWSLTRAQRRGARNRLVGFRMPDGVPPQLASLVICDGKLGGRITSSGYSPAAGAAVGLAWVQADRANNGDTIQIRVDGRIVTAVVQDEPFYDPEGEKLKA